MIVISVELWSKGYESRKIILGKMKIVNDLTGTLTRGNYKTWIYGKKSKFIWFGRIQNWPRKQKHVWDLITEILIRARKKG